MFFRLSSFPKAVGSQNIVLFLVSKDLGQLMERNPVPFGFARK